VTEFGNLGPNWLADSSRFIFTFNNKVYLGDIKTKRVREVFTSPDYEIRSVDVSRDGAVLYFTLYSSESDIWLLDLE
jgi:dipeptidyl aminopeptidase/acylaminoacyl peptidase